MRWFGILRRPDGSCRGVTFLAVSQEDFVGRIEAMPGEVMVDLFRSSRLEPGHFFQYVDGLFYEPIEAIQRMGIG